MPRASPDGLITIKQEDGKKNFLQNGVALTQKAGFWGLLRIGWNYQKPQLKNKRPEATDGEIYENGHAAS